MIGNTRVKTTAAPMNQSIRGIKPLLKDHTESDAGPLFRGNHPVDPPERNFQRLLANHVYPAAGSREPGLQMRARGRGHGHEIGLPTSQQLRGLGMPGAAELRGECPPLLLRAAARRHQFNASNVRRCPRMKAGDRTDADDGCPQGIRS
jgi:hypothetical protein